MVHQMKVKADNKRMEMKFEITTERFGLSVTSFRGEENCLHSVFITERK